MNNHPANQSAGSKADQGGCRRQQKKQNSLDCAGDQEVQQQLRRAETQRKYPAPAESCGGNCQRGKESGCRQQKKKGKDSVSHNIRGIQTHVISQKQKNPENSTDSDGGPYNVFSCAAAHKIPPLIIGSVPLRRKEKQIPFSFIISRSSTGHQSKVRWFIWSSQETDTVPETMFFRLLQGAHSYSAGLCRGHFPV